MPNPLSRTEIATLGRGVGQMPWHVVSVDVFDRPNADARLEIEEVRARILDRLPFAPRFRQKIRETVAGLDWVDDPEFDVDRHLTRHTLAAPGTLSQVTDLVSAAMARPLDRNHPLWEIVLVDGLRAGQVALVTRVHPAYVDGADNVHLIQELYDDAPEPDVPTPAPWMPAPATNPTDDVVNGVVGGLSDPLGSLGRLASRVGRGLEVGAAWVSEQGIPRVPGIPPIPGLQRTEPAQPVTRYAGGALVSLAAVNRVRDSLGYTTHDVLVGLVTGGLRQWQTQLAGEETDVVALVPLAVHERSKIPSAVGCQVAPQFETLPVRVASPQGRIDQVASLTRSRIDSGHTVEAARLTALPGFAPATLHALAARTVTAGRAHDVYIANAPGPRTQRFFGSWPLHSSYPVIGLTDSQDVTVCVTTYNGKVGFGVSGASPVTTLIEGITAELARLDAGHR